MRVLLVDDHRLFLEGLRNLLTTQAIEVVGVAYDGLDALAAARRLQPEVILMDIRMPRCDGVAATRLIKAEIPACKIVMLTMSDDEQDLFEAIKSGACGYLLKHLDAAELFSYLEELRTGEPAFSPGLAVKILGEFVRQREELESSVAPIPNDVAALTARQVQILTLVSKGMTYQEVGEAIGISERTVKYHMAELLEHLHLQNRAQAIAFAVKTGLTRSGQDRN